MMTRLCAGLGVLLLASAAGAMFPDDVDPELVYGQISTLRSQGRAAYELAQTETTEQAVAAEAHEPSAPAEAPVGDRSIAAIRLSIIGLFGVAAAAMGMLYATGRRADPGQGAVCVTGRRPETRGTEY